MSNMPTPTNLSLVEQAIDEAKRILSDSHGELSALRREEARMKKHIARLEKQIEYGETRIDELMMERGDLIEEQRKQQRTQP